MRRKRREKWLRKEVEAGEREETEETTKMRAKRKER